MKIIIQNDSGEVICQMAIKNHLEETKKRLSGCCHSERFFIDVAKQCFMEDVKNLSTQLFRAE